MSRKDFESLIKYVPDNLNNNKFKTTVEEKPYDLKNAETFLVKITTAKISEKEAFELYSDLIIQEMLKAMEENIFDVPKNLESVFTGVYLHHKDLSKEEKFERSLAERTKLIRRRSDEIERKEQNINNELFKAYFTDYQSPSSMYKKLSETKGAVNKFRVESIKKVLRKLQRINDYTPKDDADKIKKNEKIIDIVERILYFDQLNQSDQLLKILIPNQMLSRLPISLAQLKQEIILKNSKMKLGNYCILCTV